ncbi:peptidoglycan/xylan/chitin deacetylase (PgdA/CDA1 family) [Sphingomonas kaistensis]|uniref:Chitooligosaccharide deacetylase n=1 Tax=Sphingomonas kaistensis TaxID=298708 RepID=A0A7X5YAV2_9SPHN|nr:polysaccharide deacetylase family protein [Sphingomonas kaistensis]NJC06746.1 peptidoglycan/xylan/chitin deacetylase (PgdA/CDA1 family) [Sphingomonas kaistensis]
MRLIPLLLALLLTGAPAAAADKRIALTFDDAPRQRGAFFTPDERAKRLIAGLRRAKVRQAAFFVNPGNFGKNDGVGGEQRIAAYVRAGHVIANHSWSHPALTDVPATDYIANIDKAEEWLKRRPGHRPWFRFPYLNEGRADKAKRDAVRAALAQRGLRNGYVTADGADWNMEALTTDAVKAGKRVDREALRALYVETMVGAAEYSDALARKVLRRAPAQVLLLHETDLAALYIADLVKGLREAGWTIVTADEAYADPLGSSQPDVPSTQGTLTEALAWEQGLPAPRWYDRVAPKVADPLFRARVLHEGDTPK